MAASLGRYALFAGAMAAAGLPMYIHAPRYYAESMGLDLAAFGGALLLLRLFDCFQDPALGWLADRWRARREVWITIAAGLLIAGFGLIFAPPGGLPPLARLFLGMALAFTGFSAAGIAVYDHGAALAASGRDHTRIALWREGGSLSGVCLAALAPALFAALIGERWAFGLYALSFALLMIIAVLAMRGRWRATPSGQAGGLLAAAKRPGVAPLLVFAFINGLPVAATSTLFLFFVEDALQTPAHAGPMLLAFFLAAAAAVPLWTRVAFAIGRRRALMWGMGLSIIAFIGAAVLQPGQAGWFYLICIASGAAMSADLTLPPAMLSALIRDSGGAAFGLWTFAQKSALAIAAGVTLPVLAAAGYDPGQDSVSEDARSALVMLYALVPCVLKLAALFGLWLSAIGKQEAVERHAL